MAGTALVLDANFSFLYDEVVDTLHDIFRRINIGGEVRFNEPLQRHTTFQVGGPADVLVRPASVDDITTAIRAARDAGAERFVLGGGANIVVGDRGIRGVVIDMTSLDRIEVRDSKLLVQAGASMSRATEVAAENGLAGLDFLYSMPGTCGGAVWMNARCYGSSIVDVLEKVEFLDEEYNRAVLTPDHNDFDYKKSPFQVHDWIILQATFQLQRGDPESIRARMNRYYSDRESKGHFALPCAGSVFKNDRRLGAPSGKILDELGVRGTVVGDAAVSDLHANIIVNRGNATAEDIRALTELLREKVRSERGWDLEPEILFIGEWETGRPAVRQS